MLPAPIFPLAGRRVWVAGHDGLVGSALVRRLASERCEVLTAPRDRLDLLRQAEVERWVRAHRPEAVFLAAGRVGGVLANRDAPADFLQQNLVIAANVLGAAAEAGAGKLMVLGSSCLYPRDAPQPMREEHLLTGPLEPTNAPYAIAKIAALELGRALRRQHGLDVIGAIPCNLYGEGDRFDLDRAHVLPALIRKAHEARLAGARTLEVWGTGAPRREFLHADDCADALVFLMQTYSEEAPINVGAGEEISVAALARLVCEVVDFRGELAFDLSKPDGAPRKLMNGDRLRARGWAPRIALREGIARTYRWWMEQGAPPLARSA